MTDTTATVEKTENVLLSNDYYNIIAAPFGREYVSVLNRRLMSVVFRCVASVKGHTNAKGYSNIYPMTLLAENIDGLIQAIEYDYDDEAPKEVSELVERVRSFVSVIEAEFNERFGKGLIEFDDIKRLFKEGDEVIVTGGETFGGVVENVVRNDSFFGPYYLVNLKVIHGLLGKPALGTRSVTIGFFEGLAEVSKLRVRHIDGEAKAKLTERGLKFLKYCTGPSYIAYSGALVQPSWWGDREYRADGRAILDVNAFKRVRPNEWNETRRNADIDNIDDGDDDDTGNTPPVTEADAWRCQPYVYGFSLSAKAWGRFDVEGVSDIQWRDDAFDKLVLPAEEKKLVRALVEHSGGTFEDIIDGKGGGCIFLLHGEPGQGKTLTAEAVSEVLRRPLYSISVGELGTNPDALEKSLRQILDVATSWNAVLLLDEADIFLEARDERDIVRNAMVGIFLRLLEYHQGVLFLTTNRVKQIDKAFYSRISVALRFGGATLDKRRKIWTNLLNAAGITGLDVDALAHYDLNGRQIKNTIRLAQTLAKADGVPVSAEHIDTTISISAKFEEDLKAA